MKFMFSTVCIYKRKFNVDFYLKTGNKNVHLDVSGTAFIVWLTSDLQSSRANQTNLSKQSSVCGGSRSMLHSRFRTSSSFFFNWKRPKEYPFFSWLIIKHLDPFTVVEWWACSQVLKTHYMFWLCQSNVLIECYPSATFHQWRAHAGELIWL